MVESNAAAASENPMPTDTAVKVETNGIVPEEAKEDTPAIQEAVTGVTPL